jgi:hypothetical protein
VGRWWSCRCGCAGAARNAGSAAAVDGYRRVTTPGRAGAGGVAWIRGMTRTYIEAQAPRVACKVHGPTVAEVPWARHDVGFTRDFDDQVAWLAVHSSKKAITELMRIAWRTVGAIVERVSDDARACRDPLDGLTRIGIDETRIGAGTGI